jgi:NAD(P)-dependent dehydrogenase (short-subunit alcohol dehydrogenase family)
MPLLPRRFEDGVAFVTGAAAGIGRATALRLAAEGAAVLCFDLDGPAAEETAGSIERDGGRALGVGGDVRVRADLERALEAALERFGRVTYLVNVAGTVTMHGLDDMPEEAWDHVLDVNLKGVFLATQVVAPAIARHGGGAVVNISSIEAEVVIATGPHCTPHYNASKGGVAMLTKALAYELAARNVRVNAVAPGAIVTGFGGLDRRAPEVLRVFEGKLLIERLGRPEEIAAAVAFLLSDDASYITGVQLPVDGGYLVR